MTHAMLTFVAPLAVGKVSDCEKAIDKLGNPATPSVRTALALRPGDVTIIAAYGPSISDGVWWRAMADRCAGLLRLRQVLRHGVHRAVWLSECVLGQDPIEIDKLIHVH